MGTGGDIYLSYLDNFDAKWISEKHHKFTRLTTLRLFTSLFFLVGAVSPSSLERHVARRRNVQLRRISLNLLLISHLSSVAVSSVPSFFLFCSLEERDKLTR